jgi:membrane-associated phospholipid phosphatase
MHEGVKRVAQVISTIVDPIYIGCLTLLIVNTLVRGNILRALVDTSILLVCLVPGIVYRIHTRTYDNDIYKVYTMCILLVGVGTTSVLYTLIGAEATQIRSLYIGILPGIGIILLHQRWNISLHAATAMACVALLLPLSALAATFLSVPAIAVGLARLPLRQHTVPQVLAGWAYGFGTITILLRLTP